MPRRLESLIVCALPPVEFRTEPVARIPRVLGKGTNKSMSRKHNKVEILCDSTNHNLWYKEVTDHVNLNRKTRHSLLRSIRSIHVFISSFLSTLHNLNSLVMDAWTAALVNRGPFIVVYYTGTTKFKNSLADFKPIETPRQPK